ncbi:MAG TPA: cupin domain-containing protein, partial [Candidatus Atribacteria bacterium]|nr:cupin domain-containing protein [Candidatus Atribacteria bacterium]
MHITSIDEVKPQDVTKVVEGAKDITIRWLVTKDIGAPTFEFRYFEVQPGGHSPLHRHSWEHGVFIVKGKALAITENNSEIEMHPGSAALVRPWELHQFKNP